MLVLIIEIMIYDTVWVFILSIINRRIGLHLDLRLVVVHEFDVLISLVCLQFAIGIIQPPQVICLQLTSRVLLVIISILFCHHYSHFLSFGHFFTRFQKWHLFGLMGIIQLFRWSTNLILIQTLSIGLHLNSISVGLQYSLWLFTTATIDDVVRSPKYLGSYVCKLIQLPWLFFYFGVNKFI